MAEIPFGIVVYNCQGNAQGCASRSKLAVWSASIRLARRNSQPERRFDLLSNGQSREL